MLAVCDGTLSVADITSIHAAVYAQSYEAASAIIEVARMKAAAYPAMQIAEPPLGSLRWVDGTEIVACGGVKESLTLMPNGNITFCEPLGNLDAFVFGNITQGDTLSRIWNSDIPDFITRIPAEMLDTVCRDCEHINLCHTGCFLFSYRDYKNPFAIDPRCFRTSLRKNDA